MSEQFRVVSAGQPRGIWRQTYQDALQDAIDLDLASRDPERRTWFLAVPVSIERRGQAEPSAPPYPSRHARHRQAWNDGDPADLRRHAKAGLDLIEIAAKLGRSSEAVRRKAKLLKVTFSRL